MQLTAEEARRRLDSSKNLVNSLPANGTSVHAKPTENCTTVVPLQQGRSGRPKIPDFLKVKVGTLAHTESQKGLSKEFGVSEAVISKTKTGKVGGQNIQDRISENLGFARDLALERLMSTLGLIDETKLMDQDAKGLASVASSLSKVVKDTAPVETAGAREAGVQVLIYAPQQREEKKFEVVDV